MLRCERSEPRSTHRRRALHEEGCVLRGYTGSRPGSHLRMRAWENGPNLVRLRPCHDDAGGRTPIMTARLECGAASRRSLALGPGSHSACAACARESGPKIGTNFSTTLSWTPGTERSGVEGNPGPSARTRREAAPNRTFRRGLRSGEGAHPITKFCGRARLQPEAGSCDLFGQPGRKP